MLGLEVEVLEPFGEDDWVLEVGVTPNRGDCLGVVGLARELAAVCRLPLRLPEVELAEEASEPVEAAVEVEVLEEELCPRYTARVVKGVKVGPSPEWLVRRLEGAGVRTVNNVVDVTNYVMLEYGQPLHAFDYDCISGRKIVVRRAKEGEELVTLDGVRRELCPQDLVIADNRRAVALAGIMGGAESEVRESTRNVLLECACFEPVGVRRTARRLGLGSESAYRFERGVDVENLPRVIGRAAQLVQQLAGGRVCEGLVDVYSAPGRRLEVFLRFERIRRILGVEVPKKQVVEILGCLGFGVLPDKACKIEDAAGVWVQVPSWRKDVSREIDLIEEVARVFGYEKVPAALPGGCASNAPPNPLPKLERRIRQVFRACGFFEVVNFSFTNESLCCTLDLGRCVEIKNPLSQDERFLRPCLVPSLLETLRRNVSRQVRDVAVFEVGVVFEAQKFAELMPREELRVGAALCGMRRPRFWDEKPRAADYYDLKGVVEALAAELGVEGLRYTEKVPSFLAYGAGVAAQAEELGFLGQLRPELAEVLVGGEIPIFLLELSVAKLQKVMRPSRRFKPLPRFPEVVRDIAVIVPEDLKAQAVVDVVWGVRQELLQGVEVFDVYSGPPLATGYKSLAISLRYQSYERTLTDEEANGLCQEVVAELERKLGARLRE